MLVCIKHVNKEILMVNWENYVVYDETSPSGLRWKVRKARCIKVGDVVGAQKERNSWQFKFTENNKLSRFYNHRVIWEMFNGPILDGLQIDHIDGDASNNKIENLRIVTGSANSRNKRKRLTSTTGVTGVSFDNGKYCYIAHWYGLDAKQVHRIFSVAKYGEQQAFRLACECRKRSIEELNRQGAGYTERHGKES